MYLAKKMTPRSLPEIGRRFGKRDHTTVMHAVKRVEQLRADDREIDSDVATLTRLLDG
jgi:chromosomal replication initiator protein